MTKPNIKKTCILFLVLVFISQFAQINTFGYSAFPSEIKSKLDNTIVLFVGIPKCYVNNELTWVDDVNETIVPINQNGSTLIPLDFVLKNFGAKVKLTIPIKSINGRKYLPLNTLVPSLGKKMFWDSRGLIIVSDNTNVFDSNIDKDLLDSLVKDFKSYRGNSIGNLSTPSYAGCVEQDGWLYYSNWNYKDISKLSKMKKDGTQPTILTNDQVSYINILGDWIYYINVSDNDSIYKIKTDGSGRCKLSSEKALNITVLGNTIYFSVSGNICKMDLDGNDKKNIVSDNIDRFNYMNVVGNWIYYVDNRLGYIQKIRSDGTQKTVLRKKKSRELNVVAGNIYFTDYSSLSTQWKIYRIDTTGKNETKLFDKPISDLNVTGNNIFFKYSSDNSKYKIYMINMNGKNQLKISDDITDYSFCVVGDWIYYSQHYVENGFVKYGMRRIKIDGSKKEDLEPIIPEPIK